jgi:hypothetical protein
MENNKNFSKAWIEFIAEKESLSNFGKNQKFLQKFGSSSTNQLPLEKLPTMGKNLTIFVPIQEDVLGVIKQNIVKEYWQKNPSDLITPNCRQYTAIITPGCDEFLKNKVSSNTPEAITSQSIKLMKEKVQGIKMPISDVNDLITSSVLISKWLSRNKLPIFAVTLVASTILTYNVNSEFREFINNLKINNFNKFNRFFNLKNKYKKR